VSRVQYASQHVTGDLGQESIPGSQIHRYRQF